MATGGVDWCITDISQYLRKPVTDKWIIQGRNERFSYCSCTMQGWRRFQEDFVDSQPELFQDVAMFAVYDGHGGREVAQYCKEQFPSYIRQSWISNDIPKGLENSFIFLDSDLRDPITEAKLNAIVKAFEVRLVYPKSLNRNDLQKAIGSVAESSKDRPERRLGPNAGAPIPYHNPFQREVDIVDISGEEEVIMGRASLGPFSSPRFSCQRSAYHGDTKPPRCMPGPAKFTQKMARVIPFPTPNILQSYDDYKEMLAFWAKERINAPPAPPRNDIVEEDEKSGFSCGSTAVVALITDTHLYVANVGDSKCVLSRNGRAYEMTVDHTPDNKTEYDRIIRNHGKLKDGKIGGELTLSRCLGDHRFKTLSLPPYEQVLSPFPDIAYTELEPDLDEFIILATDGIWEVMTVHEVVRFVSERIRYKSLSEICTELMDSIIAPTCNDDDPGVDNMACTIIKINFPRREKPAQNVDSDDTEVREPSASGNLPLFRNSASHPPVDKKPDITTGEKKPDVTIVEKKPDVTIVEKKPDVTIVEKKPDVTIVEKKPDVTIVENKPDITIVEKKPNISTLKKELGKYGGAAGGEMNEYAAADVKKEIPEEKEYDGSARKRRAKPLPSPPATMKTRSSKPDESCDIKRKSVDVEECIARNKQPRKKNAK